MKSNVKKPVISLITLFLYLGLTNQAHSVVWPTAGTYPKEIEGDYGPREVKVYFHKGLDFLGGPKVKAVEAGTVTEISTSTTLPYIRIKGSKDVFYLHVNPVDIKKDDTVTEGQEIADYTVSTDKYGDHVDIRLDSTEGSSNPLKELFSYKEAESAPSIPEDKFKLSVKKKDGKYYINKETKKVTMEAYIETTTKDLDTIEFSFNPSIPGFPNPLKFDYHNHSQWDDFDGHNLKAKGYEGYRCDSKCESNWDSAKDTFYYDWTIPKDVKEGEYKLKVTAKTVKEKESNKEVIVIIDPTPPKVISTIPANNGSMSVDCPIVVTFDEELGYFSQNSIVVAGSPAIGGRVSYDQSTMALTFTPSGSLLGDHLYTVTVKDVKDKAGNELKPYLGFEKESFLS